MTYTESNKNSIYKWRQQNKEAWSVLHKQHSKTYYEKNISKKREYGVKYNSYKREFSYAAIAKTFLKILRE